MNRNHLSKLSFSLSVSRGWAISLLITLAILMPGCEDKRRHLAGEGVDFNAVEPPIAKDASPEAVAMVVLDALREAQQSRAGGLGNPENRQRYERAMEVLRSLSAGDIIHEQVRTSGSGSIPKSVSRDAALTLATENWVSIVAHYVDGFQFDTLATAHMVPNESAGVYVNAENPRDREEMQAISEAFSGATTMPSDVSLRAAAIERGICLPLTASIEIRLVMVGDAWRVRKVVLGSARATPGRNS